MKLEIRHGRFGYKNGKRNVLEDVSFILDKPCFAGILGPNGTGKSTLLKCVNRIYELDSGEIFFDGIPARRFSLRNIARKIAYVPQSTAVPFSVSVMDTVLMGRIPFSGYSFHAKDREKAALALKETGMEEYALRDIRFLSGGERQRVLIARALAGNPKLMLLDEPVSSLDVRHQLEVMKLLRNLVRKEGLTVLMTIHDLNLAALFCDRLLILKNGEIRKDGTAAEVLTEENIKSVYGVDVFTFDRNGKRHIQLLDI